MTECEAELMLLTADLFDRAMTRTPEQIRWSKSHRGPQDSLTSVPTSLSSAFGFGWAEDRWHDGYGPPHAVYGKWEIVAIK